MHGAALSHHRYNELAMGEPQEQPVYLCRAFGASLEVRLSFRGKVVWTRAPDDPDFGVTEPELRGTKGDPKLLCSADALHPTGFNLVDGEVIPKDE